MESTTVVPRPPSISPVAFDFFESMCRAGGSSFLGIQKSLDPNDPLILFRGARGSTLAIPYSKFDPANIFQKVLASIDSYVKEVVRCL